jgi:hypothetical protein
MVALIDAPVGCRCGLFGELCSDRLRTEDIFTASKRFSWQSLPLELQTAANDIRSGLNTAHSPASLRHSNSNGNTRSHHNHRVTYKTDSLRLPSADYMCGDPCPCMTAVSRALVSVTCILASKSFTRQTQGFYTTCPWRCIIMDAVMSLTTT